MPDQFIAQVFLDERFMHTRGQIASGELVESAREGGLRGQLLAQRKAADTP